MEFIRLKEFDRYRYRKDRWPDWVKMPLDLGQEPPVNIRLQVFEMIILAYKTRNQIPNDIEWIQAETNIPYFDMEALLETGLFDLYDPEAPVEDTPPPDPKEVLMMIPCRGKGPDRYRLLQETVSALQHIYHEIDVTAEIPKAVLHAKQTGWRTHKGMGRFFRRWLDKCREHGDYVPFGEGGEDRPMPPIDMEENPDAIDEIDKVVRDRYGVGPINLLEHDPTSETQGDQGA